MAQLLSRCGQPSACRIAQGMRHWPRLQSHHYRYRLLSQSSHISGVALEHPFAQHELEQQQQQQQQQQPDPALLMTEPCSPVLDDWAQRSRLLVGADGLEKLSAVNVLLVGLGGVGSFAAEFLCRAGVGSMTIVDGDTVDTTNRNRQLPALKSTVGELKTEVVAARLQDINPDLKLTVKQEFLDPVRAAALVQDQGYHYVIDCIDSIAPKQALLLAGHAAGVSLISSMGAGGRMDPSRVRLADISETYNDAFAAVVRRGLRKAGVSSGVTVVFSDELAKPASLALTQQQYKKSYFGTISYIPALFGLYIASHVIRQTVEPGYKLPASTPHNAPEGRRSSKGRKSRSSSADSSKRSRPSVARSSDLEEKEPQLQQDPVPSNQQMAATGQVKPPSPLFSSFEKSQGVGLGWDGDGI